MGTIPGVDEHIDSRADGLLWIVGKRWALMWPMILAVPLAGWLLAPRIVRATQGESGVLFELFAGCAVIAALVSAGSLRQRTFGAEVVPTACLLAVICLYAAVLGEYSYRSGDYLDYESAARAVQRGANPYEATGGLYRYPPLLAQILAVVQDGVTASGPDSLSEEAAWTATFFLYQAVQLFLVAGAFFLAYRLARRLGISASRAAVVVTALLVVNNPLVRTLHFNQPNLLLLNLALVAMLSVGRSPVLAAAAVAFAAHLKLYPLVLALGWLATRRVAAASWTLVAVLVLMLVQTNLGTDWTLWRAFWDFAAGFPRGTGFRDNSLHSVIFNTVGALTTTTGIEEATRRAATTVIWGSAVLGLLVWFTMRFVARAALESGTEATDALRRTSAGSADALAFALMASPMTWEHHYLLALPIALLAVASTPARQHRSLVVALAMIFAVPTFDLYPVSYHRLAGLVWLLWLTAPREAVRRGAEG